MQRTFIINADDFGLCAGVNRAIAEAHTKGVLTSTTLMANMPFAAEAVEISRSLPGLGIGVHANLVDGRALSNSAAVKAITDDEGNFKFKPGKLAVASLLCGKVREAIKAELTCQIEWILNAGIKPTHIDSHKHVHASPVIFAIIRQLAGKYGLTKIRNVYEPAEVSRPDWPMVGDEDRKRAAALRWMARVNKCQGSGYLKNSVLLGVAHTGKISIDFLKAAANSDFGITEIMSHPGYTDGLESCRTRLVNERKFELDSLCSEQAVNCFKNAGIKLVHYGQI